VEAARQHATRAVNVELIELYWQIGAVISRRIERDGWGKGTVQALAEHLRHTQPSMRGFSPQNLWRMRQFFDAVNLTSIATTIAVIHGSLPSRATEEETKGIWRNARFPFRSLGHSWADSGAGLRSQHGSPRETRSHKNLMLTIA
jgi:hypothetical protein